MNDGNMFGQTVSVQCLPGFEPRDIFNLTCGANGAFSGSLPENCSEGTLGSSSGLNGMHHEYIATFQSMKKELKRKGNMKSNRLVVMVIAHAIKCLVFY